VAPRLLASAEKRRAKREVAALPKGSERLLRKDAKGKKTLSPSQPHSKTYNR
jgi:hypothetical protein